MKHNAASNTVSAQTLTDLHTDIAEKYALFSSLQKSLPQKDRTEHVMCLMLNRLSASKRTSNVLKLKNLKRTALIVYRSLLIQTSSRNIDPNWQSPSALHAVHDEAGKESGKIILTMNDYKRDYHRDGIPYEQAFRKVYIDGLVTIGVHTCLVSSGMAGLTTILAYLQGEKFLTGPVIVGTNTYFQGKGLILAACASRAKIISETDTDAIIAWINRKKPTAIFLDSLTNSAAMLAPDLTTIVKHLVAHIRHDMVLVVGNTALSIAFQPLHMLLGRNRHIRLVIYESLIKFHQFGADRVTAGMIWAYGPGTEKLFDYRKNCGTNITDLSAHCLPPPNRKLLEARLNRMNRNAQYLAARLESCITSGQAPAFASIVYPGSPTHPSYAWIKNYRFHGCLMALRYKDQKTMIKAAQSFIRRAIDEAKRQHIPLVAGTSFGFDTTRLYLTSSNTDYGEPFLRIAVGTEDRDTFDRLASILEYVMKHH